MVSSIDGRLISDRWTPPPPGVRPDIIQSVYEDVASRFGAQCWIVGRTTMERMVHRISPTTRVTSAVARTTYYANRNHRNLAIVIDPHGKIHYGQDHLGDEHVVAVLGEGVADEYLCELRDCGVSYLFAGPDGRDLHLVMATLTADFGIESILLEGGGTINGAFLNAGLIDEISLLVYPGIDGLAGVPSIFEYRGNAGERPAAGRSLRHTYTETLESGLVWLRYEVLGEPPEQ